MKKHVDAEIMHEAFHELLESAEDYIQSNELQAFYNDDDNEPDRRELNRSDEVGVDEVLMLGGYLTLRKLLHMTHQQEGEKPKKKGKKKQSDEHEVRVISNLSDLPPEIRKALRKALEGMED